MSETYTEPIEVQIDLAGDWTDVHGDEEPAEDYPSLGGTFIREGTRRSDKEESNGD